MNSDPKRTDPGPILSSMAFKIMKKHKFFVLSGVEIRNQNFGVEANPGAQVAVVDVDQSFFYEIPTWLQLNENISLVDTVPNLKSF